MHEYGTPEYNALIPAEIRKPGSRAVIVVDVYQVSTVRTRYPGPYPTRGLLTVTCLHLDLRPQLHSPAVTQSRCTTL